MNNKIDLFLTKMKEEKLPEIVNETFRYYYEKLINGETGMLAENSIQNVTNLPAYELLSEEDFNYGKTILSKSVFIKLNGGLGTSMGLSEAKSLLKIKDDLTFLDIIAKQSEKSKIPLVLMNSFNTQKRSLETLSEYPHLKSKIPLDFLQHKIPKISVDNLEPASYEENKDLEWCPPGHGEIYTALVTSGMLQKLLDKEIEYAFISNSDNLGAVMDYKILGYFAKNNYPFLMEVANRTEADKKGGHLAQLPNSQLVLRESAQCPENDKREFQNIKKHKYFNTNNIWINLKALKKVMEQNNNILGLPMIINKKNVNPKDKNSQNVYQLETAMGSAISVFKGAKAIVVPRERFAPVKTTEDLLAVRSDNYILTDDYRVIINPERKLQPLTINLDSDFYKLVDDLDERIPYPLQLIDCESLTISGNFSIGKEVKFIGNVVLNNANVEPKIIEDGKCQT
ncbi:MAG: UTP--glucose-1-phosphate uridylyltransferase [Ignavibacteriae bacterium]|nr:MAG: UTP--glucose-1-phosphate uridylyltransferase [Ignavibacteriota bacterium]